MSVRKGIVLAGGSGTRLHPATRVISKQLLPIYDKPMIYYPLSTLMLAGIRDILVVTRPEEQTLVQQLLGDGSNWGVSISYAAQPAPEGIAQALIIGRRFLAGEGGALILGDNIFHGERWPEMLQAAAARTVGATVFVRRVRQPEQYGVIELDECGRPTRIQEKPAQPSSNLAVTGLYVYDHRASEIAAEVQPSERGEVEITAVNQRYLEDGVMNVVQLDGAAHWFDAGTPDALLDAASFVRETQHRDGVQVGCPEAIAYRAGWIDAEAVRRAAASLANTAYGQYLLRLA